MRTRLILRLTVFGTGLALCAHALAADSFISLKAGARIVLPFVRAMDMVGASKCDQSGNVYIRPVDREVGDPDEYLLGPIRQVTPQAKIAGTFRVRDVLSEVGAGRGIFVRGDGSVYQAALARGGVYVVAFAKDGSVKAKTKLQTGGVVDPWHLAVFESGGFLVSGNAGDGMRTPYTAVFDADGKLLKQIHEPEDQDAGRRAEVGDSDIIHNDGRGNDFADRGDVTLGSDGNVYLLHGTYPPLVYVISKTGEVVRKIRIGTSDSDLGFMNIQSHAGQLAIGLARFGHTEVHLTTLGGVPIRRYSMDGNEADVLSLACYDSRGFTFVTSASGSGPSHLLSSKP
jgi:hypothetical protein